MKIYEIIKFGLLELLQEKEFYKMRPIIEPGLFAAISDLKEFEDEYNKLKKQNDKDS